MASVGCIFIMLDLDSFEVLFMHCDKEQHCMVILIGRHLLHVVSEQIAADQVGQYYYCCDWECSFNVLLWWNVNM